MFFEHLAFCKLFGNCDNNLSHVQLENLHILPRPYANSPKTPSPSHMTTQFSCVHMQKAQICKTFCRSNRKESRQLAKWAKGSLEGSTFPKEEAASQGFGENYIIYLGNWPPGGVYCGGQGDLISLSFVFGALVIDVKFSNIIARLLIITVDDRHFWQALH